MCKARTVEEELRRVRGRRTNDIVKEEDSNGPILNPIVKIDRLKTELDRQNKLFYRAKDPFSLSVDSGADEMRHERMNGHDQ